MKDASFVGTKNLLCYNSSSVENEFTKKGITLICLSSGWDSELIGCILDAAHSP